MVAAALEPGLVADKIAVSVGGELKGQCCVDEGAEDCIVGDGDTGGVEEDGDGADCRGGGGGVGAGVVLDAAADDDGGEGEAGWRGERGGGEGDGGEVGEVAGGFLAAEVGEGEGGGGEKEGEEFGCHVVCLLDCREWDAGGCIVQVKGQVLLAVK